MSFTTSPADYRTPGQKDKDRIILSEPFRLMAGKFRIHTAREPELARNRLTHAIEVSRIAENLALHILPNLNPACIPAGHLSRTTENLCEAAAAASLLHDIGSTPWSEPTEFEIRKFFQTTSTGHEILSELEDDHKNDFLYFNADMQSFRIATRRAWGEHMNLSPLTLAASVKNPSTVSPQNKENAGLFHSSTTTYETLAESMEIPSSPDKKNTWPRHPLTYITETADDIAYIIADIEDAVTLGIVTPENAIMTASKILGGESFIETQPPQIRTRISQSPLPWLRTQCITAMINAASEASKSPDKARLMLSGRMNPPDILNHTPINTQVNSIRSWSRKKIGEHQTQRKPEVQKILLEIGKAILGKTDNLKLEKITSQVIEQADGHKAHAMIDLICSLTDHQFASLIQHD